MVLFLGANEAEIQNRGKIATGSVLDRVEMVDMVVMYDGVQE